VRRRLGAALAAVLVLGTLSACGSGSDSAGSPTSSGSSGSSAAGTTLTVFAASSLTATFTELGKRFEASHPGVRVRLSFGGSSDLVAQVQQGAPADVLATADTATMAKTVASSDVQGKPADFASNTLQIAVPPDNPAQVADLADLAAPGTRTVVCAPQVPCGAAAHQVEVSSGTTLHPVSEEQAVADVLTKVESGEADAGLVYVTDVRAAGAKVKGIAFPESSAAVNTYPIAALRGSGHADLARAFIDLVTGGAGQRVLRDAGFARP
jgi:molybdate transport system substrate-binding protein